MVRWDASRARRLTRSPTRLTRSSLYRCGAGHAGDRGGAQDRRGAPTRRQPGVAREGRDRVARRGDRGAPRPDDGDCHHHPLPPSPRLTYPHMPSLCRSASVNTTSCGRSTLTSASDAYISRWRRVRRHASRVLTPRPSRASSGRLWMHSKFEGVYVQLSGLCEKYEAACREGKPLATRSSSLRVTAAAPPPLTSHYTHPLPFRLQARLHSQLQLAALGRRR